MNSDQVGRASVMVRELECSRPEPVRVQTARKHYSVRMALGKAMRVTRSVRVSESVKRIGFANMRPCVRALDGEKQRLSPLYQNLAISQKLSIRDMKDGTNPMRIWYHTFDLSSSGFNTRKMTQLPPPL